MTVMNSVEGSKLRALSDDEVKLVSGGSRSGSRYIIDKNSIWFEVFKYYYKSDFKAQAEFGKEVQKADAATYALLDAMWEAENNPPPATDPATTPAPAPAPQPSAPPIMSGGTGGGFWWDQHVNLH